MAYALALEDPSVGDAVRRIAQEEAGHALGMVRATGELGPRVHAMRKTVKVRVERLKTIPKIDKVLFFWINMKSAMLTTR